MKVIKLPLEWRTDDGWHRVRARATFREPILRFFDVAFIGIVVGIGLILSGSPGGKLFELASNLWKANSNDALTLSASLAQVTLTAWTLLVSIGGAKYIDVARTIRTDSRGRADILSIGRFYIQGDQFSNTMPDQLRGSLTIIGIDTPPLRNLGIPAGDALSRLASNYDFVQDYWDLRSGFQNSPRHRRTLPERHESRRQAHAILAWRLAAVVVAILSGLSLFTFGWRSIVWELLLILSGLCLNKARRVLLSRSWRSL